MKLAIVGSRKCPEIDNASHLPFMPDVIISGGAIGIDTLARKFAEQNNIPIIEFLPEYPKYGRKAPLMRNIQIVENCDFVIALWDGKSLGTKFTLDYAKKLGKPITIIFLQDYNSPTWIL